MSATPPLERALQFGCGGHDLVGILNLPSTPARLAVLVIVGGPQYRAGSHRQFVHLCRALGAQGYPSLRFDVRGMGDSQGAARSFEALSDDIGSALDALASACPPGTRIVLWGLCDAASAALLYAGARRDPRLAGLCLLNPWVRSEETLARTQVKHYYLARLAQRDFWNKFLRGGVGVEALAGLARNMRRAVGQAPGGPAAAPASFRERMLRGWQRFAGPTLLILSGDDYTAKEFLEHVQAEPDWTAMLERERVARQDMAGADHTFSSEEAKQDLARRTLAWLEGVPVHA